MNTRIMVLSRMGLAAAIISCSGISCSGTGFALAGQSKAGIRAEFQNPAGGAITVAEVNAPAKGFVVVWLPKGNRPFRGEPIGVVAVQAGVTKNLKIKLRKAVKPGQTLGIALHRDTGKPGTFDFSISAKTDIPFMNGRRPVIEVIGVIE